MLEEEKFNVCLKGQGKNLQNAEKKKKKLVKYMCRYEKKDTSSPSCFQGFFLLTLHTGSEGSC